MSDPRHIAIIMDGNGRWAKARGLPRAAGHKAGMENLHKIVRHAGDAGLEWLTLFAFSSENWSRPDDEVGHLMSLLKYFIRRDLSELHANNVHIRLIGKREGLSTEIESLLLEAVELTKGNTGLNLVIAFNYGAQDEIARAVRTLAVAVEKGQLKAADITTELIEAHLDTAGFPDPDLIIRTSGEMRLSNFLLWQCAYSEFYFCDSLWPEFSIDDYDRAVQSYRLRERRFGAIAAKNHVRSVL